MPVVAQEYIEVDERGVAKLVGSRIKVMHLVMERMAHGWTPEQIQSNHDHLTLAQVYAAFAYYHDHKTEVDAQIEASKRFAEEMMAKHPENVLTHERLAAMWQKVHPGRPLPDDADHEDE